MLGKKDLTHTLDYDGNSSLVSRGCFSSIDNSHTKAWKTDIDSLHLSCPLLLGHMSIRSRVWIEPRRANIRTISTLKGGCLAEILDGWKLIGYQTKRVCMNRKQYLLTIFVVCWKGSINYREWLLRRVLVNGSLKCKGFGIGFAGSNQTG